MQFAKNLFSISAVVFMVGSVHAEVQEIQANRHWKRQPNPIPNPPKTFDRAYVEFIGGNGKDECYQWEARENNNSGNPAYRHFDGAPVICRQKCPPGYGTSKEKCVWQESFDSYTRLQNWVSFNDACIEEKEPRVHRVTPKGTTTQIEMSLQLNEVKSSHPVDFGENGVDYRTACTATCPKEFGWGEALGNRCSFKEDYLRYWVPRQSTLFDPGQCPKTDDTVTQNGLVFCARKCAPGYVANPNRAAECLWKPKSQVKVTP